MQMLHGGDARGDHLEGRIERVEIEIDPPRHQPRSRTTTQAACPASELHRGQPDQSRASDQRASDRSPRITRTAIRTITNILMPNALLCWSANGLIQTRSSRASTVPTRSP